MEVLQRAANRGSISTGYDIDNSLKLEIDNTEYITRTNASAGNSKTWTFSGWYKFTELFSGDGPSLFEIYGGGPLKYFSIYMYQYKLIFYDYLGGVDYGKETTQFFRDTSAWYHIVLSVDTTDATAADRMKLYINGTRVTDFNTDFGDPPLNFDTQANKSGMANRIGYSQALSGIYYSGYVSEVNFVDGQALAPTDFGEFDADTGIWKPIQTNIGSYGTNGFQLKFDNAANLGEDANGGTSFTLNNITSADQATDTPTNNFCTINTLQPYEGTTVITNGATKMGKTAAAWQTAFATMGITSGKWYWEYKTSETDNMTGIADIDTFSSFSTSVYLGQTSTSWAYYAFNGKYINNSTETTYGNTFNSTNIIGVALDMDNNKLYFAKDNTWQNSGVPTSGATGTGALSITSGIYYTPSASIYDNGDEQEFNFGGYTTISISSAETDANGYGTFEYAPPSGYYALCTKNLAEYG